MKTKFLFLLLLAIPFISSCSMFETHTYKPQLDTTLSDNIKPMDQLKDVTPLPVVESPAAVKATDAKGNAVVGFTVAGTDQLRQMRANAEANTQLAQNLLATNQSLITERNSVLLVGKTEEARANALAQQLADAQNRASDLERDNKLEGWAYKVLLFATLIVLH